VADVATPVVVRRMVELAVPFFDDELLQPARPRASTLHRVIGIPRRNMHEQ
jgi:hypothetical protein